MQVWSGVYCVWALPVPQSDKLIFLHTFIMKGLKHNVHIGRLIDYTLGKRGITYAQFARLLHCDRTTIYHLVRSKSIDTDRLLRISQILDHDFLQYYYPESESHQLTVELPQEKIEQLNASKITSITIEIKTQK